MTETIEDKIKYRSNCKFPWLGYLASGHKIVEGRVCKGKWKEMQPEDFIELYDKNYRLFAEIVACHYCKDFGELYEKFGQKLLPGITNKELAEAVYRQYFSDELVEEHGVVGIQIRTYKYDIL